MEQTKIEFSDIIKSWGFWAMIIIALILTWIADLNGSFETVRERVFDFLYNLILVIFYLIIRFNPRMDEPVFFLKKKQDE